LSDVEVSSSTSVQTRSDVTLIIHLDFAYLNT